MTPRTTEINEKTTFRLGISQTWVIVTGIIGYTIIGVAMYYSLLMRIDKGNDLNTKPLRQAIEILQVEVRYQGQYVWSLKENEYLRSSKNEAIQQKFTEFASEGNLVFRSGEGQPYKFNLEN